jgi:hypothetical protein
MSRDQVTARHITALHAQLSEATLTSSWHSSHWPDKHATQAPEAIGGIAVFPASMCRCLRVVYVALTQLKFVAALHGIAPCELSETLTAHRVLEAWKFAARLKSDVMH